ncbi:MULTISPECIES: transposase [Paenibacillus]|uniref:transposase n=1 Tax=Paenibacillus TaxID=44249 RepID=UPI001FCA44EF|nr:transposase [Paenibacillus rhizosphaerae]
MLAVKLVTEGNVSYRDLASQLGIRNKTQIQVWVKRYQDDSHLSKKLFIKDDRRQSSPV